MPKQVSRLAVIFALLLAAFVVVRWIAKPHSFYEYGHYRGKALDELSAGEPKYVERTACADCHDTQAAQNLAGPHKVISCQTCHGPGDAHIAEPSTTNIQLPVATELCLRCHRQDPARPHNFPQIIPSEHSGGEPCETCHVVHNPIEIH
jgi:hypothetical protein